MLVRPNVNGPIPIRGATAIGRSTILGAMVRGVSLAGTLCTHSMENKENMP